MKDRDKAAKIIDLNAGDWRGQRIREAVLLVLQFFRRQIIMWLQYIIVVLVQTMATQQSLQALYWPESARYSDNWAEKNDVFRSEA